MMGKEGVEVDRTILHCDCNGFYASVECIRRPELRDVPMAVCGDPGSRHGIILAKNERAKAYGIITTETVWQARAKCPQLVLVVPHHDHYQEVSRKVNEIYAQYTDQVEPFGIDESWLDVTGSLHLFGSGEDIANTLRRRIQQELGLTISVGVSFNKVFAKLGSDYKKPNATTVVSRDNYQRLLYPLPVTAMLYVGRSAAGVLGRHGVDTIGDLARLPRSQAQAMLGKSGEMIWEYANGLDESPVRPVEEQEESKSVGNGLTFRRNLVGLEDVKAGILALADTVARRLREDGLQCQTLQVQIKDPQFRLISRQRPLPHATNLATEMADAALAIVQGSWDLAKPIRMLTITGQNLTEQAAGRQLSLFEGQEDRHERLVQLESALDGIRNRFGTAAIARASLMRNDLFTAGETDSLPPPDGS